MEELINSSKGMRDGLKAEYEKLQAAFKAETDVEKMDVLDVQISKIGKDIVALESNVLSLEVAAKKSSFDPARMKTLAKNMADHGLETQRAIQEHADSVEQAKYLATRVAGGAKIIGDVLKTIA